MTDELYIWVNRWDEFQSFQTKRGKPWAPPWVKLHVHLLDQPQWIDLPPETRSLLVGIWALFARSHGTLTKDTRNLSRQLAQRVTERQLERLNHAGFITFCSGTVLEQRRAAFWNRSTLEEKREEETKPTLPYPSTYNGAEPTDDDIPIGLPDLGLVLKDMP